MSDEQQRRGRTRNAPARSPEMSRTVEQNTERASASVTAASATSKPLLALQQQAGNQATTAMLVRRTHARRTPDARDEELERDADRDADAIVARADRSSDDAAPHAITRAAEQVLGRSLDDVRVHHDAGARAATDAHDARALAFGRDVYVAPDQWSPGSREGGHLLAHELAHTAQQAASGTSAVQRQPRPGAKDDEAATRALVMAALSGIDAASRAVSGAVTAGTVHVGLSDVGKAIASNATQPGTTTAASSEPAADPWAPKPEPEIHFANEREWFEYTMKHDPEFAKYVQLDADLTKLLTAVRPRADMRVGVGRGGQNGELADAVIELTVEYIAQTPGGYTVPMLATHSDDLYEWLGPFGFRGLDEGLDNGSRWMNEYSSAVAAWRAADPAKRNKIRREGTGRLRWSEAAQRVADQQVVAQELPNGVYTIAPRADVRVQERYAYGEVVMQQIEGIVNAGPGSLLGRVIGGEKGAQIGAMFDSALPMVAAVKGYATPSARTPPPTAAPRLPESTGASPTSDLPVTNAATAKAASEAEVKRANESGAATPIARATKGGAPPSTSQAQSAVIEQTVSDDIGISGNTALKRQTGGPTSGGAGSAGGSSTVSPEAAKTPGTTSSGGGRTGKSTSTSGGSAPRNVGGPRVVSAPPGRVGPGGDAINQQYPPQAWHDIADIESSLPALRRANLRPVYRGAGEGKFAERMKTTGTSYSFQAELPNGRTVEVDGLTPKGFVVDNKELKTIAQRWREYRGANEERREPDVHEQMTGTGAARPPRTRQDFDGVIRDEVSKYGGQIERQSRFIEAYRLPRAEWMVPDAEWKTLLDAEMAERGITNVDVVVHE